VNRDLLTEHEIVIRVRYQETDAQGRVHHANYPVYFESARVELLRASGISYRVLEEAGIFLVVAELECRYFIGACFDDLLTVKTQVVKSKGVRIENQYSIWRDEDLICEGRTVVASVDPLGKVKPLPTWLRLPKKQAKR